MVIPEQSYRWMRDILTESLSLLITHPNGFCVMNLTEMVNFQFLQTFPQWETRKKSWNKISSSLLLFPLPPTVEIQVWEPCLRLYLSFNPWKVACFIEGTGGKDSCRCLLHSSYACSCIHCLKSIVAPPVADVFQGCSCSPGSVLGCPCSQPLRQCLLASCFA